MLNWHVEDDLYGSDHYPITICEINNIPTTREPTFNLKKANWDNYYLHTNIDVEAVINNNYSIDEIVHRFNSIVINASIPKTSDKVHTKGFHGGITSAIA